ncbi:hypothetical protein F5883DRAFT_68289 [Diaporthe sp. PMI_573]|nr:hypothetical protein F5883DRAFT_68289 [Diaporthaceae sp. PMI_573]
MYHVLLIFPLNQQPWKQRCQSWSTRNPLQDRDWIYGVGHIVGILNPELLKVKPPNYEDMPILVIIPSEWQITGKLQLEGAPPPPYMNTQQSVDPTTPSSQNQIRSRRYGTSSSPEQTRQTDQSSQPNPTTPVINRDATVPGPSRSSPTMTPTDQLIIESTILNQDEEDIFGTSNPPSPTTTASPTRAQQRSSRKGKQRAEQADANAESSKRKRRWL